MFCVIEFLFSFTITFHLIIVFSHIVERKSSNANQYADNHQLFLGNVPHHATEEALKVIFSKFGTVVDLRICSKSGPRVTGGRSPPNYGFIIYDDPESVQNCLAHVVSQLDIVRYCDYLLVGFPAI